MAPKLVTPTKSQTKPGPTIDNLSSKKKEENFLPESKVWAEAATKKKPLQEEPNMWTPRSVEK